MRTISTVREKSRQRRLQVNPANVPAKPATEVIENIKSVPIVPVLPQSESQARQLLELIKLYRKQEEAYLDKIRRNEFAKDEKHHLMKTRQKLDNLLITIKL